MTGDEIEGRAGDETPAAGHAGAAGSLVRFCREHPYLASVVVVFTIAGGVLGAVLPVGESLSPLQRVLGGMLVGAFFSLFPMGAHLYE
jgi:hypothetical protein